MTTTTTEHDRSDDVGQEHPELRRRSVNGGTLEPRLLSVPEAARLLGIGRTTAYELISDGELEVVKIGRSTRVPLEAVDAFVLRLRGRSAP